jgi:hypothetical protein
MSSALSFHRHEQHKNLKGIESKLSEIFAKGIAIKNRGFLELFKKPLNKQKTLLIAAHPPSKVKADNWWPLIIFLGQILNIS